MLPSLFWMFQFMNNLEKLSEQIKKIESKPIEIPSELKEEKLLHKDLYNYGLRLLARRDYSRFKMRKKMRSITDEHQAIEKTLDRLESLNYLREEEYTRQRVKGLLLKNYSNEFIINKLKEEELYPEWGFIESIRSENDLPKQNIISNLIHKKTRNIDISELDFEGKQKLKQKVMRHLLSKGFSYAEISETVNRFIKS